MSAAAGFRTTAQPVWRRSYDIGDARAQVARPIADGTVKGALTYVDQLLVSLERWADLKKAKGKAHALSQNCLKMLRKILRHFTDFATGRCEPSIDDIMKACAFSRATVIKGLAYLRQLGAIDWVRRTVRTGAAPGDGPTVKQTTNAYFFEFSRLPVEVRRELQQKLDDALIDERRGRKGSGPVPGKLARSVAMTVKQAAMRVIGQRRALRDATAARDELLENSPRHLWPQIIFPGDVAAQREYAASIGLGDWCPDASLESAPQSPP